MNITKHKSEGKTHCCLCHRDSFIPKGETYFIDEDDNTYWDDHYRCKQSCTTRYCKKHMKSKLKDVIDILD